MNCFLVWLQGFVFPFFRMTEGTRRAIGFIRKVGPDAGGWTGNVVEGNRIEKEGIAL